MKITLTSSSQTLRHRPFPTPYRLRTGKLLVFGHKWRDALSNPSWRWERRAQILPPPARPEFPQGNCAGRRSRGQQRRTARRAAGPAPPPSGARGGAGGSGRRVPGRLTDRHGRRVAFSSAPSTEGPWGGRRQEDEVSSSRCLEKGSVRVGEGFRSGSGSGRPARYSVRTVSPRRTLGSAGFRDLRVWARLGHPRPARRPTHACGGCGCAFGPSGASSGPLLWTFRVSCPATCERLRSTSGFSLQRLIEIQKRWKRSCLVNERKERLLGNKEKILKGIRRLLSFTL